MYQLVTSRGETSYPTIREAETAAIDYAPEGPWAIHHNGSVVASGSVASDPMADEIGETKGYIGCHTRSRPYDLAG